MTRHRPDDLVSALGRAADTAPNFDAEAALRRTTRRRWGVRPRSRAAEGIPAPLGRAVLAGAAVATVLLAVVTVTRFPLTTSQATPSRIVTAGPSRSERLAQTQRALQATLDAVPVPRGATPRAAAPAPAMASRPTRGPDEILLNRWWVAPSGPSRARSRPCARCPGCDRTAPAPNPATTCCSRVPTHRRTRG